MEAWFSRNHSNPCAVGTSWLLKGHLFDVDWLIFCFRCFSLCFVLYNILNTFISFSFFFSKNIGKRPAAELSVFWGKCRSFKKNTFVSQCCVCVCGFLRFHMSVDFRVPLADALGQIGFFFGIEFVDLLVWLSPHFRRPRWTPAETSQETSQETCRELAEN